MTRRRAAAALAGLILGLLAVLFSPAGAASAHAALLQSDPQANSVLASSPSEVVLTFSEPVRVVPQKIHIFGPTGEKVEAGKPVADGLRLRIPMKQTTDRGTYLISFRVISADSHPISGGIPFAIGAPSPNGSTSTTGLAPTDRVVTALLESARYLGYAGLAMVVGPALFLSMLWPRRLSRRGPLRMIMTGIGVLAVSTLAEQYLEAPYHAGTGLFGASAADLRDVFNSQFGAAHLVRIGVIAALTVLLPLFVNRPADADGKAGWTDRALVAILAVVGLATWPVSGHPAATTVPVLTTVSDAVHLGAMAVWIGGLITLFGFLLRRANARELAAILPVWSRWAMIAVGLLVAAGVAQSLVTLGSVRGLYATPYGRLLMVKVGILALVLAVAWYSRKLTLGPRAGSAVTATAEDAAPVEAELVEAKAARGKAARGKAGGAKTGNGKTGGAKTGNGKTGGAKTVAAKAGGRRGTAVQAVVPIRDGVEAGGGTGAEPDRRRLRRSVLVELIGTAVVLGLTAVLVQTTPAKATLDQAASRAGSEYNATFTTKLYQLQVQLEPRSTGANTVHLYAFAPGGGAPASIKEWKATAALPAKGIEPVEMPVLPVDDNHAVAQAQFSTSGTWELRFTLRTSDFDAASVVAQVQIK